MATVAFPRSIRMSGLPWNVQGWNGVYTQTSDRSDGHPTYRRAAFKWFGVLNIRGATILCCDGVWGLQPDDWIDIDGCEWWFTRKLERPATSPIGEWRDGIVTDAANAESSSHLRPGFVMAVCIALCVVVIAWGVCSTT